MSWLARVNFTNGPLAMFWRVFSDNNCTFWAMSSISADAAQCAWFDASAAIASHTLVSWKMVQVKDLN